ncbi:hypothetical protein BT96DRAFT_937306 [Gymnopus androsaceus JB14]|uniref:Uncharacterized protein n=1 Tax=Gymnopus androsaceus JB14 TaxID=1447944 RepID=A0A6A4HWM8_9AGAR|nr:hypothetical protein BT96DRAFT_937306 [Gymnopus androsaceus JB14]
MWTVGLTAAKVLELHCNPRRQSPAIGFLYQEVEAEELQPVYHFVKSMSFMNIQLDNFKPTFLRFMEHLDLEGLLQLVLKSCKPEAGKKSWIFGTKLDFFTWYQEEWETAQAAGHDKAGYFYTLMMTKYLIKYGNLPSMEDLEEDTPDPDDDNLDLGWDELDKAEQLQCQKEFSELHQRISQWYHTHFTCLNPNGPANLIQFSKIYYGSMIKPAYEKDLKLAKVAYQSKLAEYKEHEQLKAAREEDGRGEDEPEGEAAEDEENEKPKPPVVVHIHQLVTYTRTVQLMYKGETLGTKLNWLESDPMGYQTFEQILTKFGMKVFCVLAGGARPCDDEAVSTNFSRPFQAPCRALGTTNTVIQTKEARGNSTASALQARSLEPFSSGKDVLIPDFLPNGYFLCPHSLLEATHCQDSPTPSLSNERNSFHAYPSHPSPCNGQDGSPLANGFPNETSSQSPSNNLPDDFASFHSELQAALLEFQKGSEWEGRQDLLENYLDYKCEGGYVETGKTLCAESKPDVLGIWYKNHYKTSEIANLLVGTVGNLTEWNEK